MQQYAVKALESLKALAAVPLLLLLLLRGILIDALIPLCCPCSAYFAA